MCKFELFLWYFLFLCIDVKATNSPTANPEIRQDTRLVLYRIRQGTQVYTIGVSQNVSYNSQIATNGQPPTNLTIQLTETSSLEPVKYINIEYYYFDTTTNSTVLGTIDECLPIPNPIQGSVPYDFVEEGYVCPTNYVCDTVPPDLNPGTITPTTYSDWTGLRACFSSYEVAVRDDLPTITLGDTEYTGLVTKASLTPVRAQDTSASVSTFGIIKCGNFIDRTLNCQFSRVLGPYVEQCQNIADIGCYNFTIGYAFGGFENQNPNFIYNIPREKWTLSHWKGIASIGNFKLYALNGNLIDPYTSKVFDNYYWFSNITNLALTSQAVPVSTTSFQVDLIQAQPYSWLAGAGIPPPPSDYTSYPITDEQQTCLTNMQAASTTGCQNIIWDTLTDWRFKYPAITDNINVTSSQAVFSLILQTTQAFKGIEVFNVWGELCGSVLRPISAGENLTFSCLGTPTATTPRNGTIQVRYHGVSPIWDIPSLRVSYSVPTSPYNTDPLSGKINLQDYSTTSPIWNIMYGTGYINSNLGSAYVGSWPQSEPSSFLTIPASYYTLNYSAINSATSAANTWDTVSRNILDYNLYPYNYALAARAVELGYQQIPVDYNNIEHLDWLYNTWAVWLAMRRCTERTQCQTFDLGDCVYTENPVQIRWRSADTDASYEFIGDEGGCECLNTGSGGFYRSQLFCNLCVEGIGPLSLYDWSLIMQSAALLTPTYNPDEYPFNIFQQIFISLNPTNNPTKFPTISPTTNPTKNPTVTPTTNPTLSTKSPTTNSPTSATNSPTQAPGVYLYSAGYYTIPGLGSYSSMSYKCATTMPVICSENPLPFTSYFDSLGNNIGPNQFPTLVGFSRFARLYAINTARTSTTYLGDYSSALLNDPTARHIYVTLNSVNALFTGEWWSGSRYDGSGGANCQGWTTTSPSSNAIRGSGSEISGRWINNPPSVSCGSTTAKYDLLCMCTTGYTKSPTNNPILPTLKPTTASLTKSPTNKPTTGTPTTLSPSAKPSTKTPTSAPVESSAPSEFPTNNPTAFPTTGFPTIGPTVDMFEALLSCRYPVGKNPILGSLAPFDMCAGHGLVSYESGTIVKTDLKVYRYQGSTYIPLCTGFIFRSYSTNYEYEYNQTNERTFYLSSNATDIFALPYYNNITYETLNLINDVFYLNNYECGIVSCDQNAPELPPLCNYQCSNEENGKLLCLNPDIYNSRSINTMPSLIYPYQRSWMFEIDVS